MSPFDSQARLKVFFRNRIKYLIGGCFAAILAVDKASDLILAFHRVFSLLVIKDLLLLIFAIFAWYSLWYMYFIPYLIIFDDGILVRGVGYKLKIPWKYIESLEAIQETYYVIFRFRFLISPLDGLNKIQNWLKTDKLTNSIFR